MKGSRTPTAVLMALATALALGGVAQAQSAQGQSANPKNTWGTPGSTGWNKPGTNNVNTQKPDTYAMNRLGQQSQQAASSENGSQLTPSGMAFMKKAAQGGQAEVELGNLAQQKASNQDVKDFAQRMISDHSQANDKLKDLAQKEGVQLPQQLDPKDQALKARLEKLSGPAFDKAYMKNMVKDHTKDVNEFKQQSSKVKDPGLKNWVDSTLPTLESHLQEAKKVAPEVNAKTTASAKMHAKRSGLR